MIIQLKYPPPNFQIKKKEDKTFIFDAYRKRWILLTPEEWVRQNFLNYLVHQKNYPASLIAVEQQIHLNDKKKRFDIAVYKNNLPWMLVECKEMEVKLSTQTIDQILSYQQNLKTQFLVLTNGNETFCWDTLNAVALTALPNY
ncbi:type I restriction enzyme HsdR N-terminal domain-containing protein [Hydrotalea sp.]|uniref:type I restriction enzyme HsdR N-terminal domain-containing protein n=1 Tax=Hydrotalea sp. TaxID=2881279 RepID=UPI003D0C94C0